MKLTVERKIDKPAEQIWARLGSEFVAIDTWFSLVTASRSVPAQDMPQGYTQVPGAPALGRVTTSAVVTATEILTSYSDKDMSFAFDAVDTPAFMLTHSRNQTQVKVLDANRCQVTISVDLGLRHMFNLLSPLLHKLMSRMLNKLVDEVQIGLREG